MNELENELLQLEEDFNIFKKKVEKFHLVFILIYFSLITSIILFFHKYLQILYNNFFIKLILFSLMLFGLLIHFFLRYKYFKSKNCYKYFFKNRIEELRKNFSNEKDFNRSLVNSIKNVFKKNESQISKNDLNNKVNFWGLFINFLNIDSDEIL